VDIVVDVIDSVSPQTYTKPEIVVQLSTFCIFLGVFLKFQPEKWLQLSVY